MSRLGEATWRDGLVRKLKESTWRADLAADVVSRLKRRVEAAWRTDSVSGRYESTPWGILAGRLGEPTWRVELGSRPSERT